MIFLTPKIKKNIEKNINHLDRFTKYRLKIALKPLMDGYDWYPAYRFFQTVKHFDLNNIVDVQQREKQKQSLKKYCYSNKVLLQFLTETNCIDFENIEIQKLENYADILTSVPFQKTLWLSEYFKFFGDLRVSDFLRRQSLTSLLNEQDKTTTILPRSLQAAIELNKFETVIKFYNKLQHKKSKFEKCKNYALMRLGHHKRIERINGIPVNKIDDSFDEFVYGKTIAIVGPAIPETHVADEINNYDIVIRTNFPCGNNLPSEIYGRDPDISYNWIDSTSASKPIDLASFSNSRALKFAVFNSEYIVKQCQKNTKGKSILYRTNFDCTGLFWSGSPMAIQRIVYDLLHFSPSRISIFCANFYSTKILVHDKYEGSSNPTFSHKVSRCHDLISNFIFCKSLFEDNFVFGDKKVIDILSLNRIDYSEIVNSIVGNTYLDTNTTLENDKI